MKKYIAYRYFEDFFNNCSEAFEIFEDGEYTFILNMAKELLKRLGE